MPTKLLCPKCGVESDASKDARTCPSCGAVRTNSDESSAPETEGPGRTDRWPALNAPGIADAPKAGAPVTATSLRDSVETTLDFGEPDAEPESHAATAFRLQTVMSDPAIAAAAKRLRERMRDRNHGLKSIVDLVVLIVLADGEIDEVELVALHETVNLVVGELHQGLARYLINACVASIRADGLDRCIASVRRALSEAEALDDGLIVAYAAAFASDGLSIPERGAIQALWDGTSISYERVVEVREMVRAAVDAAS
jgi:hypothetical protein